MEAIQISEKVRGRRLLDAMTQGKVDPQQSLTAVEKQKEEDLAHEAARRHRHATETNRQADD